MKRKWPRTGIIIWMGFVMLFVSATQAAGVPSDPVKAETATVIQTGAGYLENIAFEKVKGSERIVLMLSRQSGVASEDQGGRLLLVKLENLFVPQELRRVQGEGVLRNLIRVVPVQRTVKGIPQAVVTMELNKMVPYNVRQDGHNVVVDFQVAALSQKKVAAAASPAEPNRNNPVKEKKSPPSPPAAKSAKIPAGLISVSFQNEDIKTALQQLAEKGGVKIISGDDVKGTVSLDMKNVTVDQALDALVAKNCLAKTRTGDTINVYSMKRVIVDERDLNVLPHANRLISLEFQDAPIKSIFQVLAEHGDVNIVSGDDVKGNVTIHLKKIPWKLAFDTVIRTNGLVARLSCNNLITAMTLKKFRDEEKSLEDTEKARRDAEKARKEEEQKRLEQEGRKKQISIEAKIIEATDDFTRQLGVQWGAGFRGDLEISSTNYPYGFLAGANPIGRETKAFGTVRGLAQGLALTTADLAANFPMAVAAPSYALGFAISGSRAVLDAQVLAAEKTSDVRIISSPKVTMMDGSKAVIKQGVDVPVVTPATAQTPSTVTFKEAVLKLEVKPTITQEGKISMEVKANNDSPDYANLIMGNPPISRSEVESKVVVNDGETLVVGGILKTTDEKSDSGLPWISKVPILGWLFKYEDTKKLRKQLLIFVTPRIVNSDEKLITGPEKMGPAEKPKS